MSPPISSSYRCRSHPSGSSTCLFAASFSWSVHYVASLAASLAAGIARLVIVVEDIVDTNPGARDVLGTETNVLMLAYVEVGVAIVAPCMPTLNSMLDARSLGGVVASLHPKVSLVFHGSKSSQPLSDEGGKIEGSNGVELCPSEPLKTPSHELREMDKVDANRKLPQDPLA
ncbi:hypothetical protein F4678DRAFT_486788 [Xylaria arbuscula]|nr:hypothetical protein F4678DRAFT_486788 [Xylaria arbuscula]